MRDMGNIAMMGSGGAENPIMNEAVDKALTQLVAELEKSLPKAPARVIDGFVADINESRIVMNVGSTHGVKQGDSVQLWRPGKGIRDPSTGKVIVRDDTLLGEAVVTVVNDISSIATYKGTEKVQTGDLAKSPEKTGTP